MFMPAPRSQPDPFIVDVVTELALVYYAAKRDGDEETKDRVVLDLHCVTKEHSRDDEHMSELFRPILEQAHLVVFGKEAA